MDTNDLRVLRGRHEELEDQLDRSASTAPDSPRSLLIQTTTVSSYPTVAQAFYAVLNVEASGSEAEGATPSFAADAAGNVFYAANLGTQVPPNGTVMKGTQAGGRWTFRYDG